MKNYILKHKYAILCFILYILFFIQMQNINMYADDYNIKTGSYVSNISLKNILSVIKYSSFFYYTSWSGRLIGHNIVNLIFLFEEIIMYKLLNPIFICLFCFLLAKILNIDLNLKLSKLLFFISLIIMGLDILISREVIYWTDAGILYFWLFIPALLSIYYLFNYHKKTHKFTILQFIISIICIIVVNFSMESTMMLIVGFLLLYSIYSIVCKKINIKILILCLISVILLIVSFYIPGNQSRLNIEAPITLTDISCIPIILNKLKLFITYLFTNESICYYIFLFSIILSLKQIINCNKNIKKYISIFSIILNIFFVSYALLKNTFLIDFEINYLFTIEIIYLIINLYILFITLKDKNLPLLLLIISAFISSAITIVFLPYCNSRYFFNIIVSFIILGIYLYYTGNTKDKFIILLSTSLFINLILTLIFNVFILIVYIVKKEKKYILNLLILLFILVNLYNFAVTIIKYYENDKIFEYNINKIVNAQKYTDTNTIELKRLKNVLYAYHMPENAEYVIPWYIKYYHLENYNIVWIP